jgi:DNA excision repair protein ERCC-8
MIDGRPFRKSRTNERHFGIPNPHSQLRADGLLRFRWEFTRNVLLNMRMSTDYEIISSHTRPVHCISLEKNDHQYLLSGGLDGLVALYDLNGAVNDKKNSNRKALKSISIACNSVRERASIPNGGPNLSVAVSSISWYPKDSGLFAVSDFDGNVNIWDTNAFSIVGNFKLRSKIFNSKFNSNGSLIALGLDDHSIR